jgi:hypothetical protein
LGEGRDRNVIVDNGLPLGQQLAVSERRRVVRRLIDPFTTAELGFERLKAPSRVIEPIADRVE